METKADNSLDVIKRTAVSMSGWLKFLGIINIIWGAFSAISIIGIIFAWLPIWLGVVLLQAASSATHANLSNDPNDLAEMIAKLRMYFIIQAVLVIVGISTVIIGVIIFGAMFPHFLDTMEGYTL
jgi:hypothetical protein